MQFDLKVAVLNALNHKWGLRPIATSNSGDNHTDLHAQNDWCGLGPIDTWNFGLKVAVLHAQKDRWGLGPIETSNSDAKHVLVYAQNDRSCLGNVGTCYSYPEVAVLHAKTTGGVWNQYSLFVLVLSTLLWVLKSADEVWDPHRLVSLVLKLLFCMQKPQMRAGTHRD